MKQIPIEEGNFYHIYNRGNNSIDLFFDTENYIHFLSKFGGS
jgi:putative transposase